MELGSSRTERGQATELARIAAAYRQRDAVCVAGPYRFARPGYSFYMQLLEWSLLNALRRASVELEAARVLDVGCGGGYFVHRFVEYGAATGTGVDLLPERIAAARKRYPGLRFQCANAAELPFADREFDIVTQFTCLSSVLDPDLRLDIAAEMWRVLRPGGIILSFDLRPAPWPVRAMRSLGERLPRERDRATDAATATTAISAAELGRLFRSGSASYMSVGLAFGLCPVAGYSYSAARLLACIPSLREHAIGVVVKPVAIGPPARADQRGR